MKMFLWERVKKCTSSYHPEGGVVVFAKLEEMARKIAAEAGCKIADEEKPDLVLNCEDTEEKAFIFPDAGCC